MAREYPSDSDRDRRRSRPPSESRRHSTQRHSRHSSREGRYRSDRAESPDIDDLDGEETRYRRRRGHRATDSMGGPLPSPERTRHRRRDRDLSVDADEEEERAERRRRRESRRRSRQAAGDESDPDRERRHSRGPNRHSHRPESAAAGQSHPPPSYPPGAYSYHSGNDHRDRRRSVDNDVVVPIATARPRPDSTYSTRDIPPPDRHSGQYSYPVPPPQQAYSPQRPRRRSSSARPARPEEVRRGLSAAERIAIARRELEEKNDAGRWFPSWRGRGGTANHARDYADPISDPSSRRTSDEPKKEDGRYEYRLPNERGYGHAFDYAGGRDPRRQRDTAPDPGGRFSKLFGAALGAFKSKPSQGPDRSRDKHRAVSGNVLEYGLSTRAAKPGLWQRITGGSGGGGGGGNHGRGQSEGPKMSQRKKIMIAATALIILILLIAIPIAASKSKKNKPDTSSSPDEKSDPSADRPNTDNLKSISADSVPASAKGTITDPFSWLDTSYFNVTYTSDTVAGMPVIGLNSKWDDSVRANPNVPALDKEFKYGDTPVRGINVGGWLNLEPFITPSMFTRFSRVENVVDEWTLSDQLGPGKAKATLEQHYASFIRRSDFSRIRDAGFDHVRIPFGYWAVRTYDGDPYVSQIAWRYLLRAIEWCREHGLRVKLDLHGVPGSQNGWNHSGRQGSPAWLNGTDGDRNGDRSLEIIDTLSKFFSQDRYKNVVTMYGLVNEPRMVALDTAKVLSWTDKAIRLVRKNGFGGVIVFGDGFMGLDKWQGKLQDKAYGKLLLDVHQYVIFNTDQLSLPHAAKLNFACKGWTAQARRSQDKTTGFGPTMCGEWSQADTDCTQYINNVGIGSRWDGTLNFGNSADSKLNPICPTGRNNPYDLPEERCQCDPANADPSQYSDQYRRWLRYFAEAQMYSFEQGWGWFYWTWKTESAPQWSWEAGLAAKTVPAKVWERDYKCEDLPDDAFAGLPEYY